MDYLETHWPYFGRTVVVTDSKLTSSLQPKLPFVKRKMTTELKIMSRCRIAFGACLVQPQFTAEAKNGLYPLRLYLITMANLRLIFSYIQKPNFFQLRTIDVDLVTSPMCF